VETEDFKDNLEYNDGLGDLLREKERLEFSWTKTIGILSVLIIIILFGSHILFNAGKSLITQTPDESLITEPFPAGTTEQAQPKPPSAEPTPPKVESTPPQDAYTQPSISLSSKLSKPQKKTIKQPSTKKTFSKQAPPQFPYKVIVGTFKSKENAMRSIAQFKKQKIDTFIRPYSDKKEVRYQIQAGAFETHQEATGFKHKLASKKVDSYIVKK